MHPTNGAYPTSSLRIARGRSLRLEEFYQRERPGVGDVGKIRREIELIVFLDHEAKTEREVELVIALMAEGRQKVSIIPDVLRGMVRLQPRAESSRTDEQRLDHQNDAFQAEVKLVGVTECVLVAEVHYFSRWARVHIDIAAQPERVGKVTERLRVEDPVPVEGEFGLVVGAAVGDAQSDDIGYGERTGLVAEFYSVFESVRWDSDRLYGIELRSLTEDAADTEALFPADFPEEAQVYAERRVVSYLGD